MTSSRPTQDLDLREGYTRPEAGVKARVAQVSHGCIRDLRTIVRGRRPWAVAVTRVTTLNESDLRKSLASRRGYGGGNADGCEKKGVAEEGIRKVMKTKGRKGSLTVDARQLRAGAELEKRKTKREKTPPPVFVDLLHTKGLRAGTLDLLFLQGLSADDFGQKPEKRGDGLDLRKGKELA